MSQPALLALILLPGFAGGYWIARKVSGGIAALVWLAWLASPLLVLAIVLAGEADPTLPADRASYNFAFGFVLYGFLLLIPWLPANLVGAVLGRRARRESGPAASPVPASSVPVAAQPHVDDGLPDWRHADNPRLSYSELHDMLAQRAARVGIGPESFPRFCPPDSANGEFVFIDKFDYIYAGTERGQISFEYPTVVADQLCYEILRDRARALAEIWLGGQPGATGVENAPSDDRIAEKQQAVLSEIDPRWGAYFARERDYAKRQEQR